MSGVWVAGETHNIHLSLGRPLPAQAVASETLELAHDVIHAYVPHRMTWGERPAAPLPQHQPPLPGFGQHVPGPLQIDACAVNIVSY